MVAQCSDDEEVAIAVADELGMSVANADILGNIEDPELLTSACHYPLQYILPNQLPAHYLPT